MVNSIIDEHLGYFQPLAIINSMAVNIMLMKFDDGAQF